MIVSLSLIWEFEGWANQRTLDSILALDDPTDCLGLFAHILGAQRIWFTRLTGADSSHLEVFPTMSYEQCAAELGPLGKQIGGFIESLEEADLDEEIHYANQTGKSFRNTTRDILTHLAMHSHYHRGQIASRVRQAGATPAVTDFIAFRRQTQ